MSTAIATCIGCGCDDLHACEGLVDEGCSWLAVDRRRRRGVCSQCIPHLPRYRGGDRKLTLAAARVLKTRNQLARATRARRRRHVARR